jgi:uncharacterized protein (TIGR00255 family)
MPYAYKSREVPLRQWLNKQLYRGKVDFNMGVEHLTGQSTSKLNMPLIKSYYAQLNTLTHELGIEQSEWLSVLMRLPDVTVNDKSDISDEEWQNILGLAKDAIAKFMQFRQAEGTSIQQDFEAQVQLILAHLVDVETLAPQRIDAVRERLLQAFKELKNTVTVNENRFEQELIFYIEKLDINEEIVRLRTHCQHFIKTMHNKKIAKGKKLGFIAQEMGREINTMGAKANNAAIQTHVIQMKNALEKIKEQVLNVV